MSHFSPLSNRGVEGLLENSELCPMDSLIEQSQKKLLINYTNIKSSKLSFFPRTPLLRNL